MALPKQDKPALNQWIVDERKRLGLKPDSLAAALTRLGYEVKETTVRGWESGGGKPSADGIRTLIRLFGTEPPAEGSNDLSRLIATNLRLAAAIEEQNRLSRDEVAALRRIVEGLGAGAAATLEKLGERVQALEDRAPSPRPSGPARRSGRSNPARGAEPATNGSGGR